jgi:hypothetical protein
MCRDDTKLPAAQSESISLADVQHRDPTTNCDHFQRSSRSIEREIVTDDQAPDRASHEQLRYGRIMIEVEMGDDDPVGSVSTQSP